MKKVGKLIKQIWLYNIRMLYLLSNKGYENISQN